MKFGQLKSKIFFKPVALLLFFAMTAGCGGGTGGGSRDPEAVHLDKVGSLLTEYRSDHKGNAPAKLEDLKKWAIDNGKAQDSDFVSTRDKETYVLQTIGSGSANVMVREATGKNGNKFVIISNSSGTAPAEAMSESRLTYSFGGGPPSIGKGVEGGGFPMGKPKSN